MFKAVNSELRLTSVHETVGSVVVGSVVVVITVVGGIGPHRFVVSSNFSPDGQVKDSCIVSEKHSRYFCVS